MYKERFMTAIKRTQNFDLSLPQIQFSKGKLLTDELHSKFPFMLRDEVGEVGIEELVGECLSIHLRLREPLSRIVNAPCIYTIGYVETAERNMFHQTDESLKALLRDGMQSLTLNIHAWLTLPTMEIVDFSLPTTYAVVNRDQQGVGAIIANHPDSLVRGLKYHPMLVGVDFLRRIGALKDFFAL
jgi:hypothetical protein